ncbi:hypothetical protein Taro_055476 [Colocasia esculenta]|uniref:Uncharacterized protein n=1 Tax=Colocasia esculenta TaxID=4460 RepID=A0A843XRE3_COLES|nr:hypothetical protein [Colocasia esculenta]
MESYLNPIYDENRDPAFYTSQDYEESLPHDLFGESTRPWVATVHATENHHPDDGGPSQTIHPPQSDDQATQLLRLIPQLDQSQIQTLMTALKGKAASSPSPRAGASRPVAATTGPHGQTFSCKGSVDTTINGVDTMAQSKGRNVKKISTSVDTRPGQVDTSDRSQRNMLIGFYLRSTPNAGRSTLDGSPRRPVFQMAKAGRHEMISGRH